MSPCKCNKPKIILISIFLLSLNFNITNNAFSLWLYQVYSVPSLYRTMHNAQHLIIHDDWVLCNICFMSSLLGRLILQFW